MSANNRDTEGSLKSGTISVNCELNLKTLFPATKSQSVKQFITPLNEDENMVYRTKKLRWLYNMFTLEATCGWKYHTAH
jgi:hypothetical protein